MHLKWKNIPHRKYLTLANQNYLDYLLPELKFISKLFYHSFYPLCKTGAYHTTNILVWLAWLS
jgi:hypothetical protein